MECDAFLYIIITQIALNRSLGLHLSFGPKFPWGVISAKQEVQSFAFVCRLGRQSLQTLASGLSLPKAECRSP